MEMQEGVCLIPESLEKTSVNYAMSVASLRTLVQILGYHPNDRRADEGESDEFGA